MVPTKDRNHTGVLISHKNERILVDCGEGIQRQLKIVGEKLSKISMILVSHLHGDHILGIPGLIQSMSAGGYEKTLRIYGPPGTKRFMKKLFEVFAFDNKMKIEVSEIKKGKFFENSDFVLEARQLKHNIETLGYSLIEKDKRKINLKFTRKLKIPQGPLLGKLQDGKSIKWKGKKVDVNKATFKIKGKKVTIISDTVPCNGADLLAKLSDLLVCEATYTSDLEEKGKRYGHMTAKQAAKLAKKGKAVKLILTHFSARYKDVNELRNDAKAHFKNVLCAKDFMEITL